MKDHWLEFSQTFIFKDERRDNKYSKKIIIIPTVEVPEKKICDEKSPFGKLSKA